MVDAQQARRVLDRLVGFKLSPVLWRKVRPSSAGRVQSVAVRLIVEREREIINAFRAEDSFRVTALFEVPSAKGPAQLKAELNRPLPILKRLQRLSCKAVGAHFTIEQIATRPAQTYTGSSLYDVDPATGSGSQIGLLVCTWHRDYMSRDSLLICVRTQ